MNQEYKQCQSCGMPLKQDPQGSGSEADGMRSTMYCSSCYRNGAFVQPQISLTDMQKLVDDVLKNEMKWWKPLRWLAVKQIPTLVRWKKNKQ